MTVAVLASIDQPVRRVVDRFPLKSVCKLTINGQSFWGRTRDISESGTCVVLPVESFATQLQPLQPLNVEFLERQFSVDAELLRYQIQGDQVVLSLQFTHLTLDENRHLTVWLYAEMASWKQRKQPGILDSFIAMLGAVLKLRPVMSRY